MKSYYRIMLGRQSTHAAECLKEGFIGADYGLNVDLTNELIENKREFNLKFIPLYLKSHPDKTKVSASLSCGAIHTIGKEIQLGDVILAPTGEGSYYVGEVISNYFYKPGSILPHRRKVKWHDQTIRREDLSQPLRNSTGSIGTVCDISSYATEIEGLRSNVPAPVLVSTDATIEDLATFALEEHLEEFLIKNWKQTELGKKYDIYEEDGEPVGQQYPSDTGPIDILAISKDKKELLVVELKRGRASDVVVGQIQRYMGYVNEDLAEEHQEVRGVIIALEDDLRIRRALSVARNIEFYRYQVSFKLFKG